MAKTKDGMGGMRGLSKLTKQRVDEQLRDREVELLLRTSVNLQTLLPNISDKKSLDLLIAAVSESRKNNENVAELKERISALGEGVVKVASNVVQYL